MFVMMFSFLYTSYFPTTTVLSATRCTTRPHPHAGARTPAPRSTLSTHADAQPGRRRSDPPAPPGFRRSSMRFRFGSSSLSLESERQSGEVRARHTTQLARRRLRDCPHDRRNRHDTCLIARIFHHTNCRGTSVQGAAPTSQSRSKAHHPREDPRVRSRIT